MRRERCIAIGEHAEAQVIQGTGLPATSLAVLSKTTEITAPIQMLVSHWKLSRKCSTNDIETIRLLARKNIHTYGNV